MNHFIVHRLLSKNKDALQIQDMLDEVLSMAGVDDMKLLATVQFIDAADFQHLYLIFDQSMEIIDSMQRRQQHGKKPQSSTKESRQKSRKT